MTKAVAVKSSGAVMALDELETMENQIDFDQSEMIMPRLAIVGGQSPQLKKNHAKYIAGADVGDIVDTAACKVLAKFEDEQVEFLPVVRTREAIRWDTDDKIVSRYVFQPGERFDAFARDSEGLEPDDRYRFTYDNGDVLVEHWNYYGMYFHDGLIVPCFVGMKRTNIKVGKAWNTKINNARLPSGKKSPVLYSHTYLLGTFMDGDKKNDWPNWTVAQGRYIGELDDATSVFEQSKSFADIVRSGQFKVDDEPETAQSDDEVPF